MNPSELFDWILHADYITSGLDVDWTLTYDELTGDPNLLFQGSTSKEDWLHNFQFLPKAIKPYKNMIKPWYAHKGFVNMYQSVRDDILAAAAVCGSKTIHVAGHSQGGAIAQLCAEDLAYFGYKSDCVTFGSPKVFYGKEAKYHLRNFKIQATNYENGSDIVPTLPPFAFSINPVHVGEPFRIVNVLKAADYHMGYGNPDLYK